MQYEVMECDVLIVGAGPAGLSAAIRLGQLAKDGGKELNIMVLEKAASVGAHILSGCVLEPRALNELIPDWKEKGAPVKTAVTSEAMLWLTKQSRKHLPHPKSVGNKGNYIISLGKLCGWLSEQAEALGVQIMPGFPIQKPWIEDGKLMGGITGAFGLDENGKETANYQPPIAIKAKYTLMGEGCRGSVSEELMKEFGLRDDCQHQTYGLGIKEIWQLDESKHVEGHVEHFVGWPLDSSTYGGGFIYHAEDKKAYVGFVTGLDYENPYLDPYGEFQKFKTHPHVSQLLEDGKRISYGARALNEGGLQSIPKLTFPGGAIIGCSAGFLNVPKIKGTHTAIKSGMLAAEAAFEALHNGRANDTLTTYSDSIKKSWLWKELKAARNIRPAFKWGRLLGIFYSGIDMILLRGSAPWTLKHHKVDHLCTRPIDPSSQRKLGSMDQEHPSGKMDSSLHRNDEIIYPKPDGKLTFDRASSLYLSGTNHAENQPCHLELRDKKVAIDVNWQQYMSPEQRYCPAGVYEIIEKDGTPELKIQGQNCLHCKTCDIKDITQNIHWTTPEGGGGPNYQNM